MRNKIIPILLIFICVMYSFSENDLLLSNMNNEGHWMYKYTVDDIKVYQMDDGVIPIIKLTKEIKSMNNIFETILDIENYNQVISNKKIFTEQIKIETVPDTLYGYQKVSNFIPFVKNRRIIFKMFKVGDNCLNWELLSSDNDLFDKYMNYPFQ